MNGPRPRFRLPRVWGIDVDYYVRGGGLLFVDNLAASLIGLLTTYCFANYAGSPDVYGSYHYVQSILGLLMLFSLPGMENAVMRSASRGYDGALVRGVGLRVRYSLLGTAALWAIAFFFHVRGKRDFAAACLGASVLFPGVYSFTDFRAYLRGRHQFGTYVLYGVGSSVIGSATTIAAIFLGWGFVGILLASLAGTVAGTGLFVALVIPRLRNRDVDEDFVPFARNLSWLAVLGTAVMYVDKLLVGSFMDMASLAYYKLATQVTDPIRTLGSLVNYLTFPRLVKVSGRGAFERFRRRVPLAVALLVPVGLAFAVAAPFLVRHLFARFAASIPMVGWMIVANLLAIWLTYLDTFYTSQERLHRVYYVNNVIRNGATVALMFLMIRHWGAMGMIWARIIARGGGALYLMARIYGGQDAPRGAS